MIIAVVAVVAVSSVVVVILTIVLSVSAIMTVGMCIGVRMIMVKAVKTGEIVDSIFNVAHIVVHVVTNNGIEIVNVVVHMVLQIVEGLV